MTEETQVSEVEVVQAEAAPADEVSKEPVPTDSSTADEPKEEAKPEDKPEKTFTQKELDDILTKRLAKEQRKIEKFARAEAENQYLKEQLAKHQAPQQSIPSGEPKPDQFDSYEKYIDALTDYKVEQRFSKQQEQTAQQSEAQAAREREARIVENLNKAAEKYDDFEDVIGNPNLPISLAMRDAIGESDIGGEIAYYLGTNLQEAADIAKMTPVQQVKAIDRLEQKLKAPPKVSQAPAPAEVVGKGKPNQVPDLASASLDEYMKLRQKQGARWAN